MQNSSGESEEDFPIKDDIPIEQNDHNILENEVGNEATANAISVDDPKLDSPMNSAPTATTTKCAKCGKRSARRGT
jgi:hypothetical protein